MKKYTLMMITKVLMMVKVVHFHTERMIENVVSINKLSWSQYRCIYYLIYYMSLDLVIGLLLYYESCCIQLSRWIIHDKCSTFTGREDICNKKSS